LEAAMTDKVLTGCFADGPVRGLEYRSASLSGLTDEHGYFHYRNGETVTFGLAGLELGAAAGADRVTPADLASPGAGLTDARVTNVARLLHSLGGDDADLAGGITVDDSVRHGVASADKIDLAQDPDAFTDDPGVVGLMANLGIALRSAHHARNHVRRSAAGIKKLTDVAIPTRDGSYLLADVFQPLAAGEYPAILRLSIYGKEWGSGSVRNADERARRDRQEDTWFENKPRGLGPMFRVAENAVSANAMDWVPRGYVLVRADNRGVGRTPGILHPFSAQEVDDYEDAIAWCASQSWSSGDVGLYGASYAATNQWNVAVRRPPALRAMIPFASDTDAYRELAYPGGIFNEGYRTWWWNSMVTAPQPGSAAVDFIGGLQAHPFDDESYYGPEGEGPRSPDLEQIEIPFLTAVSQTGVLHGRAGFEVFTRSRAPYKQLLMVDGTYFAYMYIDCLEQQFRFFDRFLKGEQDATDGQPAVRYIMRTGRGEFEWREADTWPIPAERRDWELTADGRISPNSAGDSGSFSYSAEIDADAPLGGSGVSFLSEPLLHDLEIAGHITATLWMGSSSPDLDVFVSLRAIGPDGEEILYPTKVRSLDAPITWGCLKASQRVTDPARSTPDRPWHTHRRVDRQPLTGPEDVVELRVELLPATAHIAAGGRLRLDVAPVEGQGGFIGADGRQARRAYDRKYHDGAVNTIYVGSGRPSRLTLPVVAG
jgi:predicted acyl esterase